MVPTVGTVLEYVLKSYAENTRRQKQKKANRRGDDVMASLAKRHGINPAKCHCIQKR